METSKKIIVDCLNFLGLIEWIPTQMMFVLRLESASKAIGPEVKKSQQ